MELMFKDNVIGSIQNINRENLWNHGIFIVYDYFKEYKKFFEALICEEGFDESQFDSELLNDKNWNIRVKDDIKGIFIPAIYSDGSISFKIR